jgi:hypothetical protein
VQQVPQALCPRFGQGVLYLETAAQPDYVRSTVVSLDSLEAQVLGPAILQFLNLLRDIRPEHVRFPSFLGLLEVQVARYSEELFIKGWAENQVVQQLFRIGQKTDRAGSGLLRRLDEGPHVGDNSTVAPISQIVCFYQI